MKMEQIEFSERSAHKIQTPGNHPEKILQHVACCGTVSMFVTIMYNTYAITMYILKLRIAYYLHQRTFEPIQYLASINPLHYNQ
jgi:hypothetical protein